MKPYHATIMVVEDNPDDQFLIQQAFKKIGITEPIQIVNDGSEAIAYMMGDGKYSDRTKYAYPSFVITDLKMPLNDGFAVLEFLSSNPEWRVIPTVVLSASSDPDDIKKAYMLGASSYHIKPPTHEELQRQLAVINAYWVTCQIPEVDATGRQLATDSRGKLGERFPQTNASGSRPQWKDSRSNA